MNTTTHDKKEAVKVTVTFPLGHGKPFKEDAPATQLLGAVRSAAIAYYGIHEEPGTRYYLSGGPHDDELSDSDTVGSLNEKNVKLTLVKELVQG